MHRTHRAESLSILLVSALLASSHSERAIADVSNTVDVIECERMDEPLGRDLKDLFRYESSNAAGNSFGRFGLGDIRVRIQTDRIPASDAFAIGGSQPSSLHLKAEVDGMAMIIPLFTRAGEMERGKLIQDGEIDKVSAEWVAEAQMETKASADTTR